MGERLCRWLDRRRGGARDEASVESRYAARALRALEGASRAMGEGHTEDELFDAVGTALAELNLSTAIFTFLPGGEELALTYVSRDRDLIRRAEELVGVQQSDFRVRPDQTRFHREILGGRRAVWVADASEVMEELLPRVPRPVLRAVGQLLGFRSVIGAPLLVGDELAGMIIVSALDFTEGDERVLSLFASQLGAMMRTIRLRDDLQRSVANLEETEGQLLEAQRRETIGLLAGGLAHDFNNLLSAIGASAELAATRAQDPELSRDLEIITQACERGSSLVSQLLAIGRRRELELEPFDVDRLLRELEGLLRRVLGEDVQVEILAGEGDKRVEGDRSQLEQVLINLALNAREAMPAGGTLTLRTSALELSDPPAPLPAGRYVELRVRDDGLGMSSETRDRAFDPFFTTKGRARGTGLGLSVVRSVVEQHRGGVWLESEPGRGTEFRILLPRTDELPTSRVRASETLEAEGDGARILVIEDDPLVRRTYIRVLEVAGFEVVAVPDGASARVAVDEHGDDFALLFSDVVLPDVRGPALLDELIERAPSAGVVVSSGYVDARTDRELIEERGWTFVAKPSSPAALVAALRSALHARDPSRSPR